ncbi:MAG: T9SS type A sorting domain-containing protein [Bacteroidota bacterium]
MILTASQILTDSMTLSAIADDCPLMSGESVFLARSLLAYAGIMKDYDDKTICQLPKSRPGFTNTFSNQIEQVQIYPNPVKDDRLQVSFPSHTYQHIELLNALGQRITTQPLSTGQQNYTFSPSTFTRLPAGIYTVRLTSKDRESVAIPVVLD